MCTKSGPLWGIAAIPLLLASLIGLPDPSKFDCAFPTSVGAETRLAPPTAGASRSLGCMQDGAPMGLVLCDLASAPSHSLALLKRLEIASQSLAAETQMAPGYSFSSADCDETEEMWRPTQIGIAILVSNCIRRCPSLRGRFIRVVSKMGVLNEFKEVDDALALVEKEFENCHYVTTITVYQVPEARHSRDRDAWTITSTVGGSEGVADVLRDLEKRVGVVSEEQISSCQDLSSVLVTMSADIRKLNELAPLDIGSPEKKQEDAPQKHAAGHKVGAPVSAYAVYALLDENMAIELKNVRIDFSFDKVKRRWTSEVVK